MQRFFVPLEAIEKDKVSITDNTIIHHIKDVLRLEEGEEAIICAEGLGEYFARITKVSAQAVILNIEGKVKPLPAKDYRLTIACALPKKAKFDEILDKLTQIGVDRIIPLNTERTIVRLDSGKKALRDERWKKIALSASQQSQRRSAPLIERLKDFKDLLSEADEFDLKLIPTLSGKRKTLKEILSGGKPRNILVLIGPEGDFSESEVGLAENRGFIPVTLGGLVLRVDTACLAAASFIKLYYENH